MKRSLVVLAMLFSLSACSGQQVQQAAEWTAGAALLAGVAVYDYKNGDDCDARCRADKERADALNEAAEERRTAQRVAELNAALDNHMTVMPVVEPEQRSVVMNAGDPVIPPEVVERFNAAMPEDSTNP